MKAAFAWTRPKQRAQQSCPSDGERKPPHTDGTASLQRFEPLSNALLEEICYLNREFTLSETTEAPRGHFRT